MSLDFVDNNADLIDYLDNKITIVISDEDFNIWLLRRMLPNVNIVIRIKDDEDDYIQNMKEERIKKLKKKIITSLNLSRHAQLREHKLKS